MKAVIYARYSSHGQTEQSIEGQLHDCYEFAEREGYTIISEYIDRAVSGRTDNRSDFQRMMTDAQKRQFSVVIVWKLDRFSRNRYDSAINKSKLKKYGVRVVSAKENITDSPEGIILEGMLESMAEYYSANLSVNIKRGQRETMSKGKFTGGRVPFGYKCVDGKLIADERTAPVMREIFTKYAQGVSKKEIIGSLNERGIKGYYGKPLNPSAFQRALQNPVYIGKFMRKGMEIEGCAEAIIDDDIFQKAQTRLVANKRAAGAKTAVVEYLLQGKVFCGHCGTSMIGECGRGKGGAVYRYYSCASRKKAHTCSKKNEKKDFIEKYVVEKTLSYVLTPSNIERIAKAVVDEYEKEFSQDRIKELERALARIDQELDSLVDALTEVPKSARQRVYTKMELLEAQKIDIGTDVAKLRIAHGIAYTEEEVTAWLRQFCKGDVADDEFCRKIIDVFINAIYLYDNRIVIFYNIKGGKEVSYTELTKTLSDGYRGSNFNAYAPPKASAFEHAFIFVSGVFGCVFQREDE